MSVCVSSQVISDSVEWDQTQEKYVDTGNQIVVPTNYPGMYVCMSYSVWSLLFVLLAFG